MANRRRVRRGVTTVSTSPSRRPLAMASAMTTPPRLCPTRCTFSGARLRQHPVHLDNQPVGELLHRGSARPVRHRVDGQAPGCKASGDEGPA